ncbi:MAG TPA: OmpH family outer membrane protein [Terracidiphilus sp.]|nr:OmpH family outer membrane protein [Terracidiphilus sp.]
MKRSLALIVMLASGIVLGAAAQTPATAAAASAAATEPSKIAVIAFQVAVGQTNEGQRDFANLEKKFQPREDQLKTLSDEVDNLTKQLQAQGATLTDAQRNEKSSAIDTKKKQLNRDAEDAKADFQQQMNDLYQSLASKVYDSMQAYAEQHGFTMVLDISEQGSPVLYASQATNITKAVIDAYNVKSGVAAPAAQPAATGTPTPSAPATKPATRPGTPSH